MSIASDLADYVSVWDLTGDLTTYAEALGSMFSEVESYAEDTDTVVGWQPLWDYTIAPTAALPWLCMIVGEQAPSGATAAQLRALIAANPNAFRGTPQAIANAVKQTLTGAQTVGMSERHRSDGTADNDALSVVTWETQTPNQNAVLGALRRSVPADIDVYYQALMAPTWATIETGLTWAQIQSTKGPTWANIDSSTSISGYVMY